MSVRNRPSVFDIPELVALIASHLPPHALAQCVATSKSFQGRFEPHLWEHFIVGEKILWYCALAPASLLRNIQYLERITLCGNKALCLTLLVNGLRQQLYIKANKADGEEAVGSSVARTPNIKSISLTPSYEDPRLDITQDHLLTLLDLNRHCLTQLQLCSRIVDHVMEFAHGALVAAISNLQVLESIVIHGHRASLSGEFALVLLEACLVHPRLTEILCDAPARELYDIEVDHELGGMDIREKKFLYFALGFRTILSRAAAARTKVKNGDKTSSMVRVKSLSLPHFDNGFSPWILFALLKSDILDLERFHLPYFTHAVDKSELGTLFATHCPRLRHLSCPGYHSSPMVSAVLRGCAKSSSSGRGGLESFSSNSFSDIVHRQRTRWITQTLVQEHASTLQEIVFLECKTHHSQDILLILTTCKQLKKYWMTAFHPMNPALDFMDVYRDPRDWVCLGLRELGLVLQGTTKGDRFDDIMILHAIQLTFAQIGRLTELRVLSLEWRINPCKDREQGSLWLKELSGLKKLRRIELQSGMWNAIGRSEVDLMLAQWPVLDEIAIECYFHEFPRLMKEPQWMRVKELRPWLRLYSIGKKT
ncbi:hypothetical protein BGZ51_004476 [Haplosporangium sp. Z 767]|nr:hypothetical protein BGZ51_004476 [Haplosporangium sp. Z 767]KAF9190229.1 hypothetical protein BGZ50_000336 [Haplosporangium sp. Z 11]